VAAIGNGDKDKERRACYLLHSVVIAKESYELLGRVEVVSDTKKKAINQIKQIMTLDI